MSHEIDPKNPCFIRVTLESIPVITQALRTAGMKQLARDVEQFSRDYTDPEANANRVAWLERADALKAKDGEIEFDSDATISHSDDGQYVLGWVWVDGETSKDDC